MVASRATLVSLVATLLLAACAPAAPTATDLAPLIESSVKGTVDALASQTPKSEPPTAAPSPTPASVSTVSPTDPPTSASAPAMVSVSLATNCRTGPGEAYPGVFSLKPGQTAEVIGRSSQEDYWFIASPDGANENCWLWGKYATVEGDVSQLPVLTPEAPPGPQVNFTMYRHSFSECGPIRVSLAVTNTGVITFKSARIRVEDLTASSYVYGPSTDSSPFGDNPSSCPKDKGSSSLAPGATAYIVIPLKDFDAGHDGAAYVRLCTDDDAGGRCITRAAFFRFPDD